MSFSLQVKEELTKCTMGSKHCFIAEVIALKQFCKANNAFTTKRHAVLQKKLSNDNIDYTTSLDYPCCQKAYLRGAFLCVGSISDPQKSNHLEFVCESNTLAEVLVLYMKNFDISAKVIQRKNSYVVYLKDGEDIANLLILLGAYVSLMNYENHRILKEISNSVNRRVNCETANIAKTVNAATKQLEDIHLIKSTCGLEFLPLNLREIAKIRLEYPDLSMNELGKLLKNPIGKSGVNHRLRKISEFAETIKERYYE